MKTGKHSHLSIAFLWFSMLCLSAAALHAKKPPPKPDPEPVAQYYIVLFEEFDESGSLIPEGSVFWGEDYGVIGSIAGNEYEDDMLVNSYIGTGDPMFHFDHLPLDQLCGDASTQDEIRTCFLEEPEQARVFAIFRSNYYPDWGPFTISVNWQGKNTRGGGQYYQWKISAQPVDYIDDPTFRTPESLFNLPVAEIPENVNPYVPYDSDNPEAQPRQVFQLFDFKVVPGTGQGKNACTACGSFAGRAFVTVIRFQ